MPSRPWPHIALALCVCLCLWGCDKFGAWGSECRTKGDCSGQLLCAQGWCRPLTISETLPDASDAGEQRPDHSFHEPGTDEGSSDELAPDASCPETGVPSDLPKELCNGKDDDCDGKVDQSVERPCFDAPASARGVGTCQEGRQVCDQGKWGQCEGAILPAKADVCLDDNCDGRAPQDASQCQWASHLPVEVSVVSQIVVDAKGDLLVLGRPTKTINWRGQDIEPSPRSLVLLRLNASGRLLDIRKILSTEGAGSKIIPSMMALDGQGSLLITGSFLGTLIGKEGASVKTKGDNDLFVCKVDPQGRISWIATGNNTGSASGSSVIATQENHIYVLGRFQYQAMFGTIPVASYGGDDLVLGRLSSEGTWMWAIPIGGAGDDSPSQPGAFAADSTGVYVAGQFAKRHDVTIGKTVLTSSQGASRSFLARFSPEGKPLWATQTSGDPRTTEEVSIRGLSVSEQGFLYVVGEFEGKSIKLFGAAELLDSSALSKNGFVLKCEAKEGAVAWVKPIPTLSNSSVASLAIAPNEDVYILGRYSSQFSLGSLSFPTSQDYDLFMARVTGKGTWDWSTTAGGKGREDAFSLALGADAQLYVMGLYNTSITLGGTTLSATSNRLFLWKPVGASP